MEFVGARRESYRGESRKPDVEAGTLEDDLARRDFTINALALSLNEADFGAVVDQYEGLKDLASKTIRTPLDPDVTFSDDPLRMLRAVRFATQLGFDIEPDTFEALARNKERLSIISQERITDELNKIILAAKPSYGFKLLFQTGLLHLILPQDGGAARGGESGPARPQGQFLPHPPGARQPGGRAARRPPVAALGRHPARHRQARHQEVLPRAGLDFPRPRGEGRALGAGHLHPS